MKNSNKIIELKNKLIEMLGQKGNNQYIKKPNEKDIKKRYLFLCWNLFQKNQR